MSGRSHRKQWRQLSVIEANDNELPAKPMQRTGEPEAPARAIVSERFRRLKRNEVVWSGDFVADERMGFDSISSSTIFGYSSAQLQLSQANPVVGVGLYWRVIDGDREKMRNLLSKLEKA